MKAKNILDPTIKNQFLDAVKKGEIDKVSDMLECYIDNKLELLKAIDETTGDSPLHIAAQYGHQNIVITLLKAGANVEAKNKNGYLPKYLAAINGNLEITNLLIEASKHHLTSPTILTEPEKNVDDKPLIYSKVYETFKNELFKFAGELLKIHSKSPLKELFIGEGLPIGFNEVKLKEALKANSDYNNEVSASENLFEMAKKLAKNNLAWKNFGLKAVTASTCLSTIIFVFGNVMTANTSIANGMIIGEAALAAISIILCYSLIKMNKSLEEKDYTIEGNNLLKTLRSDVINKEIEMQSILQKSYKL